MSAIPKQRFTEAEYLALESNSEIKHEYFHGEIFAMSGTSPEHDRIFGNVFINLGVQLRGKTCEPFSSDMRVRINSRIYTYPDISVVCGEAEFTPDNPPSLTNPTLIIEILSPSTESYDRGTKFQNYQTLESLQEYVLIAQDKARIETFTRNAENAWVFKQALGLEAAIDLTSIQCRLALADVYERITLPEEQTPPPPEF
jgi:Uma2 family endonuclease